MSALRSALALGMLVAMVPAAAVAAPTAVNGATFTLVASGATAVNLFGLTSDASGNVYAGNNSNDATGIPLQLFDPTLFSGSPLVLQDFGASLGDADGIAFFSGVLYVGTFSGIVKVTAPGEVTTVFKPGVANNGTGSPLVVRPSDGNIFVGLGGLTGINRIDEYDSTGAFVVSHATGTDVETMSYDTASGLIYYAPYGSQVRALNPATDADVAVGTSSGTIDGALHFDAISGLLFVGTASGTNAGLVETINPATGERKSFASGFNGSFGILREPVSGDLFFLEATQLYRLSSALVDTALVPRSVPVPAVTPLSLLLLALMLLAAAARIRRST